MENTTSTGKQEEKERRNGPLVLVLFIVIAALAGLSGYLFYQLNKLKSESEKWLVEQVENKKIVDDFANQLQDLTAKYDSLIRAHEGLKEELEAERSKVIRLKYDYEQLKQSGAEPLKGPSGSSLRARLETLQQNYDENESVIAELKAKNQELTNENFRNSKKLEETTAQNDKLTQENSKLVKTVEIAKRLKTYEVYADAVRVSGTKEKQTSKASKVDRIRVCFTILDNQLADKQEKYLYAVIKDPDKNIFTEGDKSKLTLLNGDEIPYSVKKNIFYDNKVMQLCMPMDVKQAGKLTPGVYKVDIYCDGVQIGTTDFELK